MLPEVFLELTMLLILAAVASGITRLLKQPLIIGYIITGILAGPFFFNIVKSADSIATFANIGVAFLLFMVGLNLNPKLIKEVGKVSVITGAGQVLFTSIIGFLISMSLGFPFLESIYISIALTFSSTIIIMKLLSDKKDTETLYGRISIGFLIVQDIIAIFILMILSSIPTGANVFETVIESILIGTGMIIILYFMSVRVFPHLTKSIARSQEYLLLFSISWCFAIAALFYYFNFSIEAGALIAGMTLSITPYHYEISSRMRPLRDFFIILFFILMGSQMVFANISDYIIPSVIFSVFILIGNPLIVMILMGYLGYTRRNGFKAGLTVAQISEFSLVLIALGARLGHLSNEILSLVTVVGLITIAGSTYMIIYSDKIYRHISRYLKVFEKSGRKKDEHRYDKENNYDIVLFGFNRIGFDVFESLKKMKGKILVIDYDPDIIRKLAEEGIDCRYGDANDTEMLEEINFSKANMVVSTIPDFDTNIMIVNRAIKANKNTIIIVVSHQIDEALRLYDQGASYVIMPHFLGGHYISTMIEENQLSIEKFFGEKASHIEKLKKKKHLGYEHPKLDTTNL